MDNKALFFIFLSVLAGLNLGSIRKAEDPIRDTQTNPILYEQKKEEEKDGKKGPLMYRVKYNREDTFFIDPPYDANEKNLSGKTVTREPAMLADNAGWWEEQPAAPETAPSYSETVSEPAAEPLPEEQGPEVSESEDPLAAAPAAEKTSDGKKDDYWW